MLAIGAVPVSAATMARREEVRFRNGDTLYGRLQTFDPGEGLRWRNPDAAEPIQFKVENVLEVGLADPETVPAVGPNACFVRLTNRDELIGDLVTFDAQSLTIETWHAGRLIIPRKMVEFIQPKGSPGTPIFEGPTGLDGWTIGKVVSTAVGDPGEWKFREGAFYATKAASIARDVKLPDMSVLEFDLAWRGSFHLAIALYTDHFQPVNLASKETGPDFGGFYSLQLNNYYVNVLAVTKADPIRYLGQVPLAPTFSQKNSSHVEIRCYKAKNLMALVLDGVLVKAWIDPSGFTGMGTGIRIVHQGQGSSRISGLRVTEWDGQFEEKPSNTPDSTTDLVRLRNGDKLQGNIETVRDGKLFFASATGTVEVPLARVKQMEMAGKRLEKPAASLKLTRASLARGGVVSVVLEKADDEGWTVTSPVFGKALFRRLAVSRLQFASPASSE
ncbi:MAG: hypothetical protein EXS31_11610 [Pedosphaera sp.]|nr:hypothetical protein [Pedosphaera sp.]